MTFCDWLVAPAQAWTVLLGLFMAGVSALLMRDFWRTRRALKFLQAEVAEVTELRDLNNTLLADLRSDLDRVRSCPLCGPTAEDTTP